jgi:hypothetical protein
MLARGIGWLLLLVLIGGQWSCGRLPRFGKPKTPPATRGTLPKTGIPESEAAKTPTSPKPMDVPAPPKVDEEIPAPVTPPPVTETQEPPGPPPEPKPASTAKRPVTAPKPAGESKPEPEPSLVPKLTQLLSEEEQWEYNREIDEKLLAISQTMAALEKRPLKAEQMEVLARVRAFSEQTTKTREVDLITARSLVRRAELLARDLEASTR